MADKTIGELPNLPAISPLDLLVAQHNEEATKVSGATLTNFFKDYIGPVAATSASQMTNTNKVYIYIGNESGYTNGNWYYYNGSSWVSGGAYNSQAVNTDATLTHEGVPADAEAAGKIVEISDTQPAAPANRVWIPETQEATVQVPTWAEHQELNGAITDVENSLESTDEALAIKITGNTNNTGTQIVANTFLVLKGHSTLADGGYRALTDISNGDTLTSSNIALVPDGLANYLKYDRVVANSNTSLTSVIQNKFTNGGQVFAILMFYSTGSVFSDFPSGVGSYGAGYAIMAGYYHTAYYQSTSGDFYMGIKTYAATSWTWTKIH